jgi:hypothetical protein
MVDLQPVGDPPGLGRGERLVQAGTPWVFRLSMTSTTLAAYRYRPSTRSRTTWAKSARVRVSVTVMARMVEARWPAQADMYRTTATAQLKLAQMIASACVGGGGGLAAAGAADDGGLDAPPAPAVSATSGATPQDRPDVPMSPSAPSVASQSPWACTSPRSPSSC